MPHTDEAGFPGIPLPGNRELPHSAESVLLTGMLSEEIGAPPGSALDVLLQRVRDLHSGSAPFATGHSESE
ncbi:hypothetical protein [Streptomyces adustus]